ncbi:DUF3310 domain-containing protein [Salmonella enterica subsp. enterica serovar Cerro]|nr:DUF3310 domain-containing protein [Salmonella enterica subsp. enterica serovar Cerro]
MNWKYIKGGEKDFVGAPEWAEKVIRGNHASSSSFICELGGIKLVACENNPESWYEFNDGFLHSVIAQREPVTNLESALAANEAVVGHDGWIEWGGGECPVDSDAIVEVKYRNPNNYQFNNDRAGDFYWSHEGFGCDIIAYRLQQLTKSEHACDDVAEADDEADLNECIGQDVDVVNHPSHYTQGDIECIDAIKASLGEEQYEGYLRGACIKYLWRYKMKSGVESLKKSEWYLKRLIELNEEIESRNK